MVLYGNMRKITLHILQFITTLNTKLLLDVTIPIVK